MSKAPIINILRRKNEFEYEILLVMPDTEAVENARTILQTQLNTLNSTESRNTPGIRFAPDVRATLRIVHTPEEARAQLNTNPKLGMLILHGLPYDITKALAEEAYDRDIGCAHTVVSKNVPIRQSNKLEMRFLDKPPDILASEIEENTLIGSPARNQSEKIIELKRIVAMTLMQAHFRMQGPEGGAGLG